MSFDPDHDIPAVQEVAAESSELARAAKQDFNFLGMLVAPEEFILHFPPFYLTIFAILTAFKHKLERFALGIPRGFAKTTFIKLLCVWYILFSHKKFILIVGAAEDLAVNTLADICDFLGSPNIRKLFGNWQADVEVDTQKLKVFNFRGRNIILRAIGAGTAVRGINRKNSRPDVIIMDDIQKREDAENKELSDALLKWVLGTLMMARSNEGCTYIYVGNMYPQNCILEKLKNNTQWTSFIVGGLLEDGTSLWEELRPAEELLSEYQALKELGEEAIFVSEILNSTDITPPSGIDPSKFPHPPAWVLETDPDGGFILIDPSSGKKDGDDCTIERYDMIDGIPMLSQVEFGTFTPLEVINTALNIGMQNGIRLICVEDVAYQSTLLFWFNHICNEHGISGFEFHPVSPKSKAKNTRIKAGLLRVLKGETYLHPSVRGLVSNQVVEWNPAKVNNKDDIIDPLGYVDEVLQLYGPLTVKQIFDVDVVEVSSAHTEAIPMSF